MGGGIQAVVASSESFVHTLRRPLASFADHAPLSLAVLVIIFAEIIPQTVCSRFGLQIGAAMVPFVRVIIYVFFVVAWPVAKLLEFLLGAHEGIVYRRAELKELVAMHATSAGHGDLQTDTVTIVGGKRLHLPWCRVKPAHSLKSQPRSTCRQRSSATP